MTSTLKADAKIQTDCGDKLRAIVADVLKLEVSASVIDQHTNLYDLGLDSLSVVGLLTAIENVFGISIDVEDLSNELFQQYANLSTFVQQKIDADQ